MTAYTARLNAKIVLPSGNWFSGFKADSETNTVVYTYHDRRRAGQVARHYTVTFKSDLSTIESVTAVSAKAGRVEHFKSVSIREDLAIILRAAKSEAFEESLEKNEQSTKDNEKNVTAIVIDALVNKMGVVMSIFALVAFALTLIYFLFGDASMVEAVMNAIIGAEGGALIALFAVVFASEVKNHK